jgi:hypothetical protein
MHPRPSRPHARAHARTACAARRRLWRGAGLALPVFAARTRRSVGCGEFLDLLPLVDFADASGMRLIQVRAGVRVWVAGSVSVCGACASCFVFVCAHVCHAGVRGCASAWRHVSQPRTLRVRGWLTCLHPDAHTHARLPSTRTHGTHTRHTRAHARARHTRARHTRTHAHARARHTRTQRTRTRTAHTHTAHRCCPSTTRACTTCGGTPTPTAASRCTRCTRSMLRCARCSTTCPAWRCLRASLLRLRPRG